MTTSAARTCGLRSGGGPDGKHSYAMGIAVAKLYKAAKQDNKIDFPVPVESAIDERACAAQPRWVQRPDTIVDFRGPCDNAPDRPKRHKCVHDFAPVVGDCESG
mmetsp:Transcript_8396/g.21607  ORF Transcript_8396/g.21607 Transcript_8396/m.21607 type:complete len:104 (-) Transcript_8396:3-314(-)